MCILMCILHVEDDDTFRCKWRVQRQRNNADGLLYVVCEAPESRVTATGHTRGRGYGEGGLRRHRRLSVFLAATAL